MIEIFTDGSSLGNPGPGGYAAIIRQSRIKKEKIIKGGEAHTTNNRMEMRAVTEALKALPVTLEKIRIRSDSTLVVSTMAKGWKKKENLDLWNKLEKAAAGRDIEWIWIKGHAGHEENIRCDRFAVGEARKIQKKSGKGDSVETSKLFPFFCRNCEKPIHGDLSRIASGAIRVDCEHCGKFVKFAKQTKEILKRVSEPS